MTDRIPWVESRAPRPAVEMRKWLSISSLLFLSFRFPFLHRSMKRPIRESCLFTRSAQLHEEDPEDESRLKKKKGMKKNLEVTQRSAKAASYHGHLGFCIMWILGTLPESEFLVPRFKFNLFCCAQ